MKAAMNTILDSLQKNVRSIFAGPPKDQKFGTFGGVFTPNVLTILGIILYLRLGWGCR